MARNHRTITRVLLAGAVVAAPLAVAAPANAASESTWDSVAKCEATGNWKIDSGNGFSGGLQFTRSTWAAFGGTQYSSNAKDATREQQIAVAERVLQQQGPGAWPVCSKKAGLTEGALENQDVSAGSKSKAAKPASETKAPKPAAESKAPAKGQYTVRPGDTLGKIAAESGVDWQKLVESNKNVVSDPSMIFPGQQLTIK